MTSDAREMIARTIAEQCREKSGGGWEPTIHSSFDMADAILAAAAPARQLELYRAAGKWSCCPERKMRRVSVPAQPAVERWKANCQANAAADTPAITAWNTRAPITPAQAAKVLLSDDLSVSKMAKAMHDGPLMADDHWFSASTAAGGWCVDMARAALRGAIAEQEADHERG